MPRELHCRMKRRAGLHIHFAMHIAATAAARHLHEQLEHPFAGAEIGQLQRRIGIDHTHAGHVGEMQSFRNHLRADQNIDLAPGKSAEGLLIRILVAHRIRIHAHDSRRGESRFEHLLDFLRARAALAVTVELAFRTPRRRLGHVIAQVAAQFAPVAVISQRHAATRAFLDMAALRTLERSRIAAAVEENDRLFVFTQPLVDGFRQTRRNQ